MTEHGDNHFKCPHCGQPIEVRKARSVPRHKFNHDAAMALLDSGMSVGHVARIFGVTHQAVAYVAKRRNHT